MVPKREGFYIQVPVEKSGMGAKIVSLVWHSRNSQRLTETHRDYKLIKVTILRPQILQKLTETHRDASLLLQIDQNHYLARTNFAETHRDTQGRITFTTN